MADMKTDFTQCLTNKVSFKGYGLEGDHTKTKAPFTYEGKKYEITHGSVVIAAITSCTNTSNPDVMLAAGLVAKNAIQKGLTIQPYIKTSLSPGSGVVTEYFKKAGVQQYLD
jgi:aconitate hydratase